MLWYASRLKAWARTQAPRGKPRCEGTALHHRCLNCPARFSPSSPNAEQLAPAPCRETHRGARAGGWTVTIEELTHCQPTPLLSSPRVASVTIPTRSELQGPRGKGCLQHAGHIMKPSQKFCKAHQLLEALGEEPCLWR